MIEMVLLTALATAAFVILSLVSLGLVPVILFLCVAGLYFINGNCNEEGAVVNIKTGKCIEVADKSKLTKEEKTVKGSKDD